MSKTFRKYRFATKAAASTKIAALGTDEDGNATHGHLIVELGHEITTPATYDDDGEILTEAVYADTYLVDVLWDGEAEASWNNQLIWMSPFGLLVMGASDVQREWLEKCKELHPEYFPEPSEEENVQ
jgi:hypothetical protein